MIICRINSFTRAQGRSLPLSELIHQFDDFGDLRLGFRTDGFEDASVEMGFQDGAVGPLEDGDRRQDLGGDVDAVAVLFDHPDDPLDLALRRVQQFGDLLVVGAHRSAFDLLGIVAGFADGGEEARVDEVRPFDRGGSLFQVDGGEGDAGDALERVFDAHLAVHAAHAFDVDGFLHDRYLPFSRLIRVGLKRRRRSAFSTTETEERLIASDPRVGSSRNPNAGKNSPTAIGIPTTL